MDFKTLLVNFVTTFVATFLAISLFVAINRPPQPRMPEHMPPMPPSASQPQPGQLVVPGRHATPQTAAPAPVNRAQEPAKK